MTNPLNTEFLKNLLSAAGPSSYESRPAAVWRKQAETYGAETTQDAYGNSFALVNKGGSPRIFLAGHIDEIGLIVTYIDDNGFIYVRGIGGWDPQQLTGQRVRILGYKGDIMGLIGKKPIHLMKPGDRRKVSKIQDMWLDIGAKDGDETKKHVRVGDAVVLEQPYLELLNGRIASKALDNRLGAYVVLEAARRSVGAEAEVIAAATIQEEIGHAGAAIAAFGKEPHVAIAVDVTHATDAPTIDKKQQGDVSLGSGVAITIGSVIHRGVFNALVETAEAEKIPYTIETSPIRTATDGDDIMKVRSGVPTGLVSIPNRYMHSPNEMIDLDDLEQVIRLITAYIKTLDGNSTFMQPE